MSRWFGSKGPSRDSRRMLTLGTFVTGWALLAEFVFCLAMALRCYPLQPGGLLALESLALGLTTTTPV